MSCLENSIQFLVLAHEHRWIYTKLGNVLYYVMTIKDFIYIFLEMQLFLQIRQGKYHLCKDATNA